MFACVDAFLPRIVELAESAADRSTRVAACEVLHSCVLVAIARSHGNTASETQESFSSVFEHLFPSLLRLAADEDAMPRQLRHSRVADGAVAREPAVPCERDARA